MKFEDYSIWDKRKGVDLFGIRERGVSLSGEGVSLCGVEEKGIVAPAVS